MAILRDNFSQLDRDGLIQFLKSCQCEDGRYVPSHQVHNPDPIDANSFSSFSPLPNGGEADLRSVYCAFAISSMLNDWSGIDIPRSLGFIERCAVSQYNSPFAYSTDEGI